MILFPGWEKDKNNAMGGPELKISPLNFFFPSCWLPPQQAQTPNQIAGLTRGCCRGGKKQSSGADNCRVVAFGRLGCRANLVQFPVFLQQIEGEKGDAADLSCSGSRLSCSWAEKLSAACAESPGSSPWLTASPEQLVYREATDTQPTSRLWQLGAEGRALVGSSLVLQHGRG